jgi:Acetyltransferase (GNAT) domain
LVRDESPAAARGVAEEVLSRACDAGVRLLIVQPPEGGQAVERALDERRFETGGTSVAPDATLRLDVRRSDEELLELMSRMRRRSLVRPAPEHFSVGEEADPELFHRLHRATAARLGFTPIDLRALLAQWEELRPRRCAIIVARHRGLPVCALWVTAYAGTVTAKLGGWDRGAERSGAPSNANAAVHWEAVRWARASGAHTFDFGGIDRAAAEALVAGERPPPGFAAGPLVLQTRLRRDPGAAALGPVGPPRPRRGRRPADRSASARQPTGRLHHAPHAQRLTSRAKG